jgi:hypothetical protein
VTLCVVVGAVVLYQVRYPQVSPIDEFAHADYAMRIAQGDLVRRGDHYSDKMLREFACRGLDHSEELFRMPACPTAGQQLDAAQFPEGGLNTAFIHPPTYYVVAAVGGMVSEAFGKSFWAGARLSNLMWALGGAALLLVALRSLGVNGVLSATVTIAAVVNPTVLHSLSTVNNDAAALCAAALALVAYLRWRASGNWWWLVVASLGLFLKVTFVLPLLVVGLLVLTDVARGWRRDRSDRADQGLRTGVLRLVPLFVFGAATLGVLAAVTALQAIAGGDPNAAIPQLVRFRVGAFPWRLLASAVQSILPFDGYKPRGLDRTWLNVVFLVVALVTLVAAVASSTENRSGSSASGELAVANDRSGIPTDLLGSAVFCVVLAAGPLLVVVNFLASHIYVGIPPRYLVSLVPLALVASAKFFNRSTLLRAVAFLMYGGASCALLIPLVTVGRISVP